MATHNEKLTEAWREYEENLQLTREVVSAWEYWDELDARVYRNHLIELGGKTAEQLGRKPNDL